MHCFAGRCGEQIDLLSAPHSMAKAKSEPSLSYDSAFLGEKIIWLSETLLRTQRVRPLRGPSSLPASLLVDGGHMASRQLQDITTIHIFACGIGISQQRQRSTSGFCQWMGKCMRSKIWILGLSQGGWVLSDRDGEPG